MAFRNSGTSRVMGGATEAVVTELGIVWVDISASDRAVRMRPSKSASAFEIAFSSYISVEANAC